MATIAVFLSSFGDGGAHKNMINIARWLNQGGHNVDLVLTKAEGKLEHAVPDELDIYNIDSSRVRYSLFGLWKYVQKNQPDSLIATPVTCTIVAGIVDQLTMTDINITLRIPVILSNEPYYTNPNSPIEKLFPTVAKYIYQHSDHIIAISEGVKSDLIENFMVPAKSIEVIYNPAITEDIFLKMTEEVSHPFLNNSEHTYIGVGRLVEQKGFDTLIESFKNIRNMVDAKLIILGDGKLKEDLIELTESLSISSDVSFPGFVKNPYKYIYRADSFVLSSRSEGFGNVVAEALACGTPVIATDCESGPSEILREGEFGTLVPVDDSEKLSEAMISNLDMDIDVDRLRNRANDFHIDNIGPKYERMMLRE